MHQRSKLVALFMASILSNPTCAFAEENAFYLQGLGGFLYPLKVDFTCPVELGKSAKPFTGGYGLSGGGEFGLGLGYQIPERNLRIGVQLLKHFISYCLPEASVTQDQIKTSTRQEPIETSIQSPQQRALKRSDTNSHLTGNSITVNSISLEKIERIDIPVDINIFMLSADYSLPMDESCGFFVSVAGGVSYNKAQKPEYFAPGSSDKQGKILDFYTSAYTFQPAGSISVGLDWTTSNESLSMQIMCRAIYLGKSVAYKIKADNSAAKYSDIQVDLGWSGSIMAGLKFDL